MNRSIHPLIAATACAVVGSIGAPAAQAMSFTIDSGHTLTSAQTLTGNETGTVKPGGLLSLRQGDDDVAITVSGDTRIDNAGTIRTQGSGRGIRNDGRDLSLEVINRAGGLLQTADADPIQLHEGNDVVFDNYGTVDSRNQSEGGAQAIDFNHITQGQNTVNNYAGGTLKAFEADGVRTGVDGKVVNEGTIKSINAPGSTSSSDGIDAQSDSGARVVNHPDSTAATSLIEGARHGITGGNTDTSTNGDFALHVNNHADGTIRGNDGSGINIDGFNGNERVDVINHGRIIGDGVTGDGDGVDVDGLVELDNSGIIRSRAAFDDTSEGVTVGGGTIVNSGIIEGDNVRGGASRGITLAGLDKNPSDDAAIPTQGIFADSSVINRGLIKGQGGAARAITGAGNDRTVTIINRAGGVLEGGGNAAAVFTGANDTSVINYGTITADSSGRAVDLSSGHSSLEIRGATAQINGDISGGTGHSRLVIAPGEGHTFIDDDDISNFGQARTGAGTVVLNGQVSEVNHVYAKAGTLIVGAKTNLSARLAAAVDVAGGATLGGNGTVSAATVAANGSISPGDDGVGGLTIDGPFDLNGTLNIDIADADAFDTLDVDGVADFGPASALALNVLGCANLQAGQSFDLLTARSFRHFAQLGLQGMNIAPGLLANLSDVALSDDGSALRLTVQARRASAPVPAPGGLGLLAVGLALIGAGWRYRGGSISG